MLAFLPLALTVLAAPQAPAASVAAPNRLERVVVIGASMAAGFGVDRTLGAALEASIRAPHTPVLGLGDMLFFTSPLAIGERQVEAALDRDPTLLVGIDFLFWYGYGNLDKDGGPIERESQRLELLEVGLALLEEVECPLVVGDFPDMSSAVGKMLMPAQMPDETTLPLLSKRVREWAAAREDTLVLPLSEMVVRLGSQEEVRMGRHTFPPGSKMLQRDQLHPTLDGLVAVAQLVCDELVKVGLAREDAFEFELAAVTAKLRKVGEAPVGAPR